MHAAAPLQEVIVVALPTAWCTFLAALKIDGSLPAGYLYHLKRADLEWFNTVLALRRVTAEAGFRFSAAQSFLSAARLREHLTSFIPLPARPHLVSINGVVPPL